MLMTFQIFNVLWKQRHDSHRFVIHSEKNTDVKTKQARSAEYCYFIILFAFKKMLMLFKN